MVSGRRQVRSVSEIHQGWHGLARRFATVTSVATMTVIATLATGTGTAGAAHSVPVISNSPRYLLQPHFGVRNTWAALNWSGYAETGTFAGVSGTWTVPMVSASSTATYSSTWLGVDGFNDSSLIQTGTEEDYYSGSAHYNAWWEILPKSETPLPGSDAVAPNDRMSASIYETSATATSGPPFRRTLEHLWVITIADTTQGWSYSTNQWYSGPGSSAEWVVEAPQVGGQIATLAHYAFNPPAGVGDFDNAGVLQSVVSSGAPTYTGAKLNAQADSGVMVQNGVQVSTPSTPDTVLTAFNSAYGSVAPAAPTG